MILIKNDKIINIDTPAKHINKTYTFNRYDIDDYYSVPATIKFLRYISYLEEELLQHNLLLDLSEDYLKREMEYIGYDWNLPYRMYRWLQKFKFNSKRIIDLDTFGELYEHGTSNHKRRSSKRTRRVSRRSK